VEACLADIRLGRYIQRWDAAGSAAFILLK
jgi:hypothetical protein